MIGKRKRDAGNANGWVPRDPAKSYVKATMMRGLREQEHAV